MLCRLFINGFHFVIESNSKNTDDKTENNRKMALILWKSDKDNDEDNENLIQIQGKIDGKRKRGCALNRFIVQVANLTNIHKKNQKYRGMTDYFFPSALIGRSRGWESKYRREEKIKQPSFKFYSRCLWVYCFKVHH